MQLGSPAWQDLIRNGAAELGLPVSDCQLEMLTAHAAELVRWNRKTNLTAITDPEEIAVKHILDCLAALRAVPPAGALLDIGSGGGFPGLIFKIMRPGLSVTLIDSIRKKVSFLSHCIRLLGLKGISALQHRAETLVNTSRESAFDVITCRAVCDIASFVPMALPLSAPGGRLIALKGRLSETEAELNVVDPAILPARSGPIVFAGRRLALSLETYRLPYTDLERTLVVFQRPAGHANDNAP